MSDEISQDAIDRLSKVMAEAEPEADPIPLLRAQGFEVDPEHEDEIRKELRELRDECDLTFKEEVTGAIDDFLTEGLLEQVGPDKGDATEFRLTAEGKKRFPPEPTKQ